MVPGVKAATVIVYDHPMDSVVKPQDECLEVINASDGLAGGTYSKRPDGSIWLWGGTNPGWVLVNSTIESNVIYIQYGYSDDNDGYTYIYVDGDLVSSDINTFEDGVWYVEIRNLPMAKHTVKVGAFGPDAEPAVDDIQDDNVARYFGFEVHKVGGISIPVDKFGLLAPYLGLASTIVAATVATVVYVKRVKRRKEKQ